MMLLMTTVIIGQPPKRESLPVIFLKYITVTDGITMTPRAVTQTRWDTLVGYTSKATTFEGIFWDMFAPTAPPVCAIAITGGDPIYEYQGSGFVVTTSLSYSVVKSVTPPSSPLISAATVTCNQAVASFPINFHDGNTAHNQSGTRNGIALVNNVTNTFTVHGRGGDGRTSTSSVSIYFVDQRYWGTSATGVISDANILAFETGGDSDFSAGYSVAGTTYTFTSVTDDYVVICLPYSAYPTQAQIGAFIQPISSYFIEYDDGGVANYQLTNTSTANRTYKVLVSLQKYTASSLDVILFQ